jgi:hypothetical protein
MERKNRVGERIHAEGTSLIDISNLKTIEEELIRDHYALPL